MTAILTFNVILLALCAWFSLFRILPSCAVSFLRYRLWRLRDELVDEIRAGKYDDVDVAQKLVALTEAAIQVAPDVSVLNLTLRMLTLPRGVQLPHPLPLNDVDPHDRAFLEERLGQLDQAVMMHALTATPSGWLVMLLALPFAIISAIRDRLRGKSGGGSFRDRGRRVLRKRLDVDPALALMSKRAERRRKPLYRYV